MSVGTTASALSSGQVDKRPYLPRQSLAGEWTSVSTFPAKFGGGGIVNLLNFGDEDEDDDDDEKRLLGLRQAGSRRQKINTT